MPADPNVNRRGAIYNRTLFRYAEISDEERAADDLLACGQARTLKAEDYAAFVACLPKDILVAGARVAGRTDIRVSWPKQSWPTTSSPTFRSRSPPSSAGRRSSSR